MRHIYVNGSNATKDRSDFNNDNIPIFGGLNTTTNLLFSNKEHSMGNHSMTHSIMRNITNKSSNNALVVSKSSKSSIPKSNSKTKNKPKSSSSTSRSSTTKSVKSNKRSIGIKKKSGKT